MADLSSVTTVHKRDAPLSGRRRTSLWFDVLVLAAMVTGCLAAGVVGAVFTADSVDGWYRTVDKPHWTPPDWVFGPVWTTLYIMMGVAAWLVWRQSGANGRGALALFGLQLILNVGWSLVFFGFRRPGAAFVEILVLWLALAATIVAFAKHSRWAAALLVPYLAWSTFAAALNGTIWWLNRDDERQRAMVQQVVARVPMDPIASHSALTHDGSTQAGITPVFCCQPPDDHPAADRPTTAESVERTDRADSPHEKLELRSAARDYYRELAAISAKLPQGNERFVAFLQAAFRLAKQRSQESDPVLQNRAALVALGALLGDRRVASFVGTLADDADRQAAERAAGQVTIRGRRDWTQHFCVSAAITSASNAAASNQIGLLKERMDSRPGGSGFSFADLAADRAGTRLAVAATRDADAARAMQARLSNQFRLDDVFPQAADLPEGISEAELKSRFGGINGPGYKRLIAEIERRLDRCAALK